jgi:hypothetical protein
MRLRCSCRSATLVVSVKSVLFLFAATTVAFGQAPQPTAGDCAVEGVVVNSLTGEPIPRAHVDWVIPGATSSASADSSGKWNLSRIACGTAPVLVTRPGFIQKVGSPLTLVSGSPVHDLKIELTPQSVFYGRVLDDQGDPVMGGRIGVLASRVVDGRISFQRVAGENTNDLGDYRIASLPRGKYIVCASLAGALSVADTCYPGPVEGGATSAMEVPAGRETRVDFALTQAATIHIRGTVSGLPAGRGAGVNLVKRGGDPGFGGNVGAVSGNHFDLRAAPGSYILASDYFEGGKRLSARVPIEAGTSDIDNIAVTLEGVFTVSGAVSIASVSGRTPARPQFTVNLRPTETTGGSGQAKWAADHNTFTFEDMVPGSYRLAISRPAPFYVKSATLAGQDILNDDFALTPGAGPIAIALSDDGGSIEGDVVDADGQPATGGVIALRNGRAVVARATGHFKLQNVAPGDYTVYAWDDPAEVAYADTEWMRRYAGNGVAVTVTASQNTQVKLTQQKIPE